MQIWGRKIVFVEYIGHDEQCGLCVSRLFDNFGNLFTYVWEIDGDDMTIWFGEKGSSNRFVGRFSEDGNSYSGAWKWPGGGYEATGTRVSARQA